MDSYGAREDIICMTITSFPVHKLADGVPVVYLSFEQSTIYWYFGGKYLTKYMVVPLSPCLVSEGFATTAHFWASFYFPTWAYHVSGCISYNKSRGQCRS